MEKRNILIAHGWLHSAKRYERLKRELEQDGNCNVTLWEFPGFGDTPAHLRTSILKHYAQDVETLLRRGRQEEASKREPLGKKAFDGGTSKREKFDVLIGHSMGGNILLRAAVSCSYTGKLILLNPEYGGIPAFRPFSFLSPLLFIFLLCTRLPRPLTEPVIRLAALLTVNRADLVDERLIDDARRADPAAAAVLFAELAWDRYRIPRGTVFSEKPVLLISSEDRLIPAGHMRLLRRELGDCTAIVFKGIGHTIVLEDYGRLVAILKHQIWPQSGREEKERVKGACRMNLKSREIRYAEKLSRMVQCETVSNREDTGRDKFYRFHELLAVLFPAVHRSCEKHVFDGSLLFKWPGIGGKDAAPILFMSHHDVVEAGDGWQHPPFSGEIVRGRIWGRGTVDTKGSLFCILQAVEELIEGGVKPACDVYLASSCTEEHSGTGAPMTAAYLRKQGVHLRFLLDEGGMIMDDPVKGVTGTFAMVGCLEKGYGDIKLTAKGSGGHASVPVKGTPLARLADFIHDVERNNPFPARMNRTTAEMFRRMAPYAKGPQAAVFRKPELFAPILETNPLISAMTRTTMTFTMAHGADGANVLPQEAWVIANMRFIHHQGAKKSIARVKKLAARYGIETTVITAEEPAPVVDYEGEAFHLVEKTIEEIFPGTVVTPYAMTGGTDARFYRRICDNAIRFAPLKINAQQHSSIHGVNENLDTAVLLPGVDFYKRIIEKM